MEMTKEERFLKFAFEDGDVDFYEEHLMRLTDEEVREFCDRNPGFMSGLPVTDIKMLRDDTYRGILKMIEKHTNSLKCL